MNLVRMLLFVAAILLVGLSPVAQAKAVAGFEIGNGRK